MNVFISLPMRGRDIEDIRNDMNEMFDLVKSKFNEINEDMILLDTLLTEYPDFDVRNEGTWYLGKSIQLLSKADVVVFHQNWREAKGCIIEHMICALYDIPYIDISVEHKPVRNNDD